MPHVRFASSIMPPILIRLSVPSRFLTGPQLLTPI